MKILKIATALLLLFLTTTAAPASAVEGERGITVFLDREGKLTPLPILLPWTEHTEDRIKGALSLLINGEAGYTRTVPKNTKVNRVFIDAAKVIYLDFSKELFKEHPGGVWTETLTITSICKTIFANFEAHSIRILIDGKEVETLAGHIDLSTPLTRERVEQWLGEGEI